jgi:hypothetical protein
MFNLKKVMPFLLVLLLPLAVAVETATTRIARAENPGGTVKSRLFRLTQDQPLYFMPLVYARIDQITVYENWSWDRHKVLKADAWRYDPQKGEVTLKEPVDDTKYYLKAQGTLEYPVRVKLKDVDYDTLTVLKRDNLALEGRDYFVDRVREELVFSKAFDASGSFRVAARRKSVGIFTAGNAKKDYSQPVEFFKDATVWRRLGKVREYQVRQDRLGQPKLYIGELNYSNPSFYSYTHSFKMSDRKLTKEIGFPVSFPAKLGAYQMKYKYITYDIRPVVQKRVGAKYQNTNSYLRLTIEKKPVGYSMADLTQELAGCETHWVKDKAGKAEFIMEKEYRVEMRDNYYFAQPEIKTVHCADLVHDAVLYEFVLSDYDGNDGAAQVKECLREYAETVLEIGRL